MTDNNGMAVQNALQGTGIQFAMPQSVLSVPKTSHQVQKVVYDQAKLQALKDALAIKRPTMGGWESFANTLAQTPEMRSFTGAYGTEVFNPLGNGISTLMRGFGSTYGARKASEREAAEKAREDAIKAAQMDLEASKQQVTDSVAQDYIKFNDPNAKTMQQLEQEETQKQAAVQALKDLKKIADENKISAWNNESKSNWNSASTAKTLGVREQALSALIPLTNSIARASGGSGINTVGEMLAYLGVPENATSRQLEGVLPGLARKLGLEQEIYQQTPIKNSANKPIVVNGYTIEME